ncbi:MAG: NUDIX domain-containing protein [Bdellovibrionota bacterium]
MGSKLSPAADVFVLNSENKVLLVKRTDNGFWCLPGGKQDLGETSAECAARECFEESGYKVKVTGLLGVYSSQCYEYKNYPWTDDEFCHVCYRGEITGGEPTLSSETSEVGWFSESEIPPLSDGHDVRIKLGFKMRNQSLNGHFE